jgi:hypothetical protein
MPLYLCRWPNGDCSFVLADTKREAIELLDEIANAEGCVLAPIQDFMAHFRLTDTGELEFEEFGEVTEDVLFETAYPDLNGALLDSPCDEQTGQPTPEGAEMIRAAVAQERQRVKRKEVPEPETELGRKIKSQTDAPTQLVDRIVRNVGKERLERFRSHGKPN